MRRRSGLVYSVAAPLLAVVFALLVSAILLQFTGHSALVAYGEMLDYGSRVESLISALNRAVPLYVAGLAVAIGFKMNLFNIGVEGQYKIASLIAAWVGAAVVLPAVLHVIVVIAVAVLVGAAWAALPALLKVRRGVHEVISTIMLNGISTGITAYLLANYLAQQNPSGDLILKTAEIPASGRLPQLTKLVIGLGLDPGRAELHGFLVVGVLLGVGFHLMVNRTRFGYDLRASGVNPGAAEASGVDPKRMVVITMLLSGAVAGMVGLSDLLGFFYRYSLDFPTQLGFTGIAVALVGRNHPIGIAAGALLFGWFDRAAQILQLRDIPREIVGIMQGILILSVVVAYAVAAQRQRVAEAGAAARELQAPPEPVPVAL